MPWKPFLSILNFFIKKRIIFSRFSKFFFEQDEWWLPKMKQGGPKKFKKSMKYKKIRLSHEWTFFFNFSIPTESFSSYFAQSSFFGCHLSTQMRVLIALKAKEQWLNQLIAKERPWIRFQLPPNYSFLWYCWWPGGGRQDARVDFQVKIVEFKKWLS